MRLRRKRPVAPDPAVRDLQRQLLAEREARNADIRRLNAEVSRERAAHARTKASLRRYVEDTEGVKQNVTTLDNAIGFALGALLTLDEHITHQHEPPIASRGGKPADSRVLTDVQHALRAIGRSLKPHAPKFVPSVPLGNLIETAQIRRWTGDERAAREKIAALPPADRAALKAAAETSDLDPEAEHPALSQAPTEDHP